MKFIPVGIVVIGCLMSTSSVLAATEKEIQNSADKAGEYIVRMTDEIGKFVYEYDPIRGENLGGYNILRHGGTVYALLELYLETHDPELLEAAERAIDFLVARMIPCPEVPRALCVEENNEIKLGGNGLALLALATYEEATGDTQYRDTMQQLAEWIVAVQDESGDFAIHKLEDGEPSNFRSEYYPGEAMYGLMKLYTLDGNERWLRAVQKGVKFIINSREQTFFTALPADHWLLYALNELHQVDPDPVYVNHAERIAWLIILTQNDDGGYYEPSRSAPTATRMEGLAAAHEMFDRTGKRISSIAVTRTHNRGIDFLLELQFDDTKIERLQANPNSQGGFPASMVDHTIRIDYPQHALSALLGMVK